MSDAPTYLVTISPVDVPEDVSTDGPSPLRDPQRFRLAAIPAPHDYLGITGHVYVVRRVTLVAEPVGETASETIDPSPAAVVEVAW